MDDFKKQNSVDYQAAGLTFRGVIKHTLQKNKLEKIYRRQARRRLKNELKKELDFSADRD